MRDDDKSLTYTIIGAAMEIHRRLGPWHLERVYHRALKAALERQGLRVLSEPKVVLQDEDGTPLAVYRPDLVVRQDGQAVLVELKAEPALTDAHLRQVKAYLSAWRGRAEGLVVNFGSPRLGWKKVWRGRRFPDAH